MSVATFDRQFVFLGMGSLADGQRSALRPLGHRSPTSVILIDEQSASATGG
jgi:hypothetical protein